MGHHSRHRPEVPASYWKSSQAYILAVITLMLGLVVGYLFHGSSATVTAGSPSSGNWSGSLIPPPADSLPTTGAIQALLDQLKNKPNDPDLLANIGNQYYDGREYGKAIEYYEKSLKLKPGNVSVRTDMGTAIWYSGDPDRAIREYETSLRYQPNHPQTLFNMGVVKWQGKQDRKAALELWQKLLSTAPAYPERQKVEQMMQQVKAEMR